MISVRFFFVYFFVLLNSLTSFICSSELRKECMPGKSLNDLYQQHNHQLRSLQTSFNYRRLMYLNHKVNNLRYNYNNADYKYTLTDLKELQTAIDKSEKKLAATENELQKTNKDFFDLKRCIKEREFDQLPIK